MQINVNELGVRGAGFLQREWNLQSKAPPRVPPGRLKYC